MGTENIIACASCQNPLVSYTGKQESVACPKCGNGLMLSMGQSFVSGKAFKADQEVTYTIKLGTELTINKTPYRVVGVAIYKEKSKPYKWYEYTLYNDVTGFDTLSSYENTFNLVRVLDVAGIDEPAENGNIAHFDGADYRLYNQYEIRLVYAEGEFPYHISHTEKTQAREYLSGPDLIIIHEQVGVKKFFRAEYVERTEVGKSIHEYIPKAEFINPTTPLIKGFRPATAGIWFLLFLVPLILMSIVQYTFKPQEMVFVDTFTLYPDSATKNKVFTSESFSLDGMGSNIGVDMETDVGNNWFAMAFSLVNETTNTSLEFENGVEYYWGMDGGERWTEGSADNTVNITNIRPGRYHVAMQPIFSERTTPVVAKVRITKNVFYLSNYLWMIIVAGIFPIVYMLFEHNLNRKRWYFSDYSPYTYDDDEED